MWWWLLVAISTEVMGTLALKASQGFTRPLPAVVVVVLGYGVAFVALSRTLVLGMSVGTAYAIWAGVGVALVALLGVLLFAERLSGIQVAGVVMVVAGVVAIEAGASH